MAAEEGSSSRRRGPYLCYLSQVNAKVPKVSKWRSKFQGEGSETKDTEVEHDCVSCSDVDRLCAAGEEEEEILSSGDEDTSMVEACEENNVLGDSACHDAEEFAIADDQNDDPMNQEIYADDEAESWSDDSDSEGTCTVKYCTRDWEKNIQRYVYVFDSFSPHNA